MKGMFKTLAVGQMRAWSRITAMKMNKRKRIAMGDFTTDRAGNSEGKGEAKDDFRVLRIALIEDTWFERKGKWVWVAIGTSMLPIQWAIRTVGVQGRG